MDLENKYGTLPIQRELLSLMKEIHAFFLQNHIQYSVGYGTLLGAVRHKGFIPWDDDLDIIVDRQNYQKIHDGIIDNPNLCLERDASSPWVNRIKSRDSQYSGPYTPTCDIFLIDGIPESGFLANLKMFTIFTLQGMMKQKPTLSKGGFAMKLCSLFTFLAGRLFSQNRKYKWYQSVSQWFTREGQQKRCYNACFGDVHCAFPADVLDNVHLASFEDTEVCVIDQYDPFLKARYGDYMSPPPSIEQSPKHF